VSFDCSLKVRMVSYSAFGSFAFTLVRTSGSRSRPETTIIFHFKLNPLHLGKKIAIMYVYILYTYSAPSLSLDTFGMSVIANPSNYGHFFCLSSVSHREFYSTHWPIPINLPSSDRDAYIMHN